MLQKIKEITFLDTILWAIRTAILGAVIWGTAATIIQQTYPDPEFWVNLVIIGIAQGSLYALIAMGYTLVYGVLFMINFAHGEFFMSGTLVATVFLALPMRESGFLESNPVVALLLIVLLSMFTAIFIAVLTERIAYRPLRKAPRLVPLITAIGASFFWQYFFRGLFGSQLIPFPELSFLKGSVDIFGITVLKRQILIISSSIIMMIGLYTFVMRTRTGKAIRAVAENKDVAALMGIDVDRSITITFTLGAAMAGAAGILYAITFRQVDFFMGFVPGIKAFTAAVLGGIGSIPGAALGGLFLGIFESVGPNLFLESLGIASTHQLKDVIAFTMLVLVLIFRPQGIIGERLKENKA